MQYEEYLLHELIPLIRQKNRDPRLIALGLSFGGYHAVNIALRHPEIVSGFVSLSGTFDLTSFLDGYYDQDCYFHLPTHYLPRLTDPRFLDRFRRNRYVLATGWDDQCLVPEPEPRPYPEREGNPARIPRVGSAQRARLARMAANDPAILVTTRRLRFAINPPQETSNEQTQPL